MSLYAAVIEHCLVPAFHGIDWQVKGAMALVAHRVPNARTPHDIDVVAAIDEQEYSRRIERLSPSETPADAGCSLVRSEAVTFTPGRMKPAVHRMLFRAQTADGIGGSVLVDAVLGGWMADGSVMTLPPDLGGGGVGLRVTSVEACLAEKLMRYGWRRKGGRVNTRWTDLLDMLIVARYHVRPFRRAALRDALDRQIASAARAWPPPVGPPAAEWLDFWDSAMLQHQLRFGTLDHAAALAEAFWRPVIDGGADDDLTWDPSSWSWGR